MIAATLAFNEITPAQGFAIFDRDGDTRLSYDDLLHSLLEMQMPIALSHPDVRPALVISFFCRISH